MFGSFNNVYSYGENIAYGITTVRKLIIASLVDDGVKDRGHRINIYAQWTDVRFGWLSFGI